MTEQLPEYATDKAEPVEMPETVITDLTSQDVLAHQLRGIGTIGLNSANIHASADVVMPRPRRDDSYYFVK